MLLILFFLSSALQVLRGYYNWGCWDEGARMLLELMADLGIIHMVPTFQACKSYGFTEASI